MGNERTLYVASMGKILLQEGNVSPRPMRLTPSSLLPPAAPSPPRPDFKTTSFLPGSLRGPCAEKGYAGGEGRVERVGSGKPGWFFRWGLVSWVL